MSQNIFDATQEVNNQIQRNHFDWKHNNSFTSRFGYLYPLFSSLLPANSKFKCEPRLALQLLPMIFPVQTPMKARLSFFKVPLRTLWKDYMDYVGNFRDNLEAPYHDLADKDFDKFFGESQLGDFIDIPNVLYGDNSNIPLTVNPKNIVNGGLLNADGTFYPKVGGLKINDTANITSTDNFVFQSFINLTPAPSSPVLQNGKQYTINLSSLPTKIGFYQPIGASVGTFTYKINCQLVLANSSRAMQIIDYSDDGSAIFKGSKFADGNATIGYQNIQWNENFTFTYNNNEVLTAVYILFSIKCSNYQFPDAATLGNLKNYQSNMTFNTYGASFPNSLKLEMVGADTSEYNIITPNTSPYYSSESNPEGLKIRAYRARAYEAIYNSYYRDIRNNPFYVDGEVQYNKWLPNYDGGADNYPYQLHRANWEKDFLTTAIHSPQQGKSPLVGLTQYSEISNGNATQYNLSLVTESGEKYKVTYDSSTSSVKVAEMLPDDTNIEPLNIRNLLNSATLGFTIPDLRVVNAYQKFLELNIRKGYSYKDIIEGRFDCKVKFDELQMPEFIGGFTRDIQMNRVVQSVDTNSDDPTVPLEYGKALGSLGGDGFMFANDVPTIQTFCDEECIIMAIMSVVPVPTYSQLLPKDYLYNDILDHFNPEFNNLGYQPIKYGEVCPIQAKLFGVDFNDTFGYQRPWYEYVSKVDTTHGLMRTQLRNFLMNRQFNALPRLNKSFLLVDDTQLNDVFAVTDTSDKIIGQCYFDMQVELPIHRIAIPRLD